MDLNEISRYVQEFGVGSALDTFDYDDIQDVGLSELWWEAVDRLDAIGQYLSDNCEAELLEPDEDVHEQEAEGGEYNGGISHD